MEIVIVQYQKHQNIKISNAECNVKPVQCFHPQSDFSFPTKYDERITKRSGDIVFVLNFRNFHSSSINKTKSKKLDILSILRLVGALTIHHQVYVTPR